MLRICDEEKEQLKEQVVQLRLELQLSVDENERLREQSREQESDFKAKLEDSLQRLEMQTTDISRRLGETSVGELHSQITEK